MEAKGKVLIGFGEYEVGRSIKGPTNLMLELEADGYVELDSNEAEEIVEKKKRGPKPKEI